MPQAAPSSGQPRPISRLGRAGRPYRPWFRHSPARLRSLCCCASVPWVEISCARWVWREPRTSAPTVIDCCAVAFASANLAHCRCPVPSTASAATAGRGFGVALMEAWPVGRRNGLSSGSITEKEGQDDNSRLHTTGRSRLLRVVLRPWVPSLQTEKDKIDTTLILQTDRRGEGAPRSKEVGRVTVPYENGQFLSFLNSLLLRTSDQRIVQAIEQ